MTQRMIVHIITAERPFGARRNNSLVSQERLAVENFTREINTFVSAGWVPMGPMVLMERLMVQQLYTIKEVDDEVEAQDEEE